MALANLASGLTFYCPLITRAKAAWLIQKGSLIHG